MNFGEYLKEVLAKRNTNLTKLAQDIGIKSKNEIYRLFENQGSYRKAKNLTDRIIKSIDATEEEQRELYRLMEDFRIKKSTAAAYSIMERIYRADPKAGVAPHFTKAMERFKKGKITVIMSDYENERIALALDNFIERNPETDIQIIHNVNFNSTDETLAREMYVMTKLLNREEYECVRVRAMPDNEILCLAEYGGKYVIMVMVHENGVDRLAQSEISEDMYKYLIERRVINRAGRNLREMKSTLLDFVDIINKYSIIDKNNSFVLGGMLCIGDMPFDILHSMFREANYFGLAEDSDLAQRIISSYRERDYRRRELRTRNRYVLSAERVEEFMQTGIVRDQPAQFRPFTPEERVRVMSCFLEEGSNYEFRFPKRGYAIRGIDCVVVENSGIVMYDASKRYGKDHFQIMITHPKVQALYKRFCEYFWESCTLSEKKSKQMLSDMLEKCGGGVADMRGISKETTTA